MQMRITVSQQMAILDYIDPDTTNAGSGLHSASQNLNHAMVHGLPLDPQQQYMDMMLHSAMHNLGQNLKLTRYDHSSFAKRLLQGTGLDMNTASISQLKNALVGMQFAENKYLSTSYNDFRNAAGGNPFTNRQIKITYQCKANVQGLMPGDTTNRQGQRQRLGEIILDKNAPQKVVGVRELSKSGGRAQGTAGTGARQIEIVIEVG